MTRPSRPRKAASLSSLVHHQLDLYALAASAAGVGALALAQPAEAKIVYTPAHVPIIGTVNIDLNHDGIVDFKVGAWGYSEGLGFLDATSLGKNRVWGSATAGCCVVYGSHLKAGVRIKPNQRKFAKGASCGSSVWLRPCKELAGFVYSYGSYRSWGPWAGTTNGYLGLKFYVEGKVHFGWARLQEEGQGRSKQWVLTGYAYETIAGRPIVTGRKKDSAYARSVDPTRPAALTVPVSQHGLGMLALGAPALAIWRQKERADARR